MFVGSRKERGVAQSIKHRAGGGVCCVLVFLVFLGFLCFLWFLCITFCRGGARLLGWGGLVTRVELGTAVDFVVGKGEIGGRVGSVDP